MKDRLEKGRDRLEETRERVKALCEPVDPPRDSAAYIRFFCARDDGNLEQLKANEQKRVNLYKFTAAFVRAYANLANEMNAAGYSDAEAQEIKEEVRHYQNVSQEIKLASGDYVDLKAYEPDMRHLIDTYIGAEESETLSTLGDTPLVQLIVENGPEAMDLLPGGVRNNEAAAAATIENNIRRLIVDRSEVNPRYYEHISRLLNDIIRRRRDKKLDYRAYLSEIEGLSWQVAEPENQDRYPSTINTDALRALFDNLDALPEDNRETVARAIDDTVRRTRRADWRNNRFRQREVRNAIARLIDEEFSDYDDLDIDAIFQLVMNQNDY